MNKGPFLEILSAAAILFALSGCVFFRKPGNLGSYAVCQAIGESKACGTGLDVVEQAEATGYWDLSLNFPGTVDGVGTLISLSDAFGVRRVGNLTQCLPDVRSPNIILRTPKVRTGTWQDFLGFHLRPEDFVRLENVQELGPQFSDLQSIEVRISASDIMDETLDTAKFISILQNSVSAFNAVCRSMLQSHNNLYLVTGALTVTRMQYVFYGKSRKKIKIDKSADAKAYFSLDPSIDYSFSSGLMQRNTAVYVALKDVEPIEHLGSESKLDDGHGLGAVLHKFCRDLKSCVSY